MSAAGLRTFTLGVVAAPGLPADIARQLSDDLRDELARLYPELVWELPVVSDALVAGPALTTEVIDAARRRLLDEDWELVVVLTDLPLRIAGRNVAGHASVTHGVIVLSLPAIGAVGVRRRVSDAAARLIDSVLGHPETSLRLQRLEDLVDLGDEDADAAGLVWLTRGGRPRLIGGMLRANRPWRLAARLYRALVAALAVVAAALVTTDVWRIAAALGWVRLAIVTVVAVAATTASLIAVHGLWERGGHERAREQIALFNVVTTLTVLIGICTLYAALFAVTGAGALLLVPSSVFESATGRPIAADDYLKLIWLVTSLSTVGGALGAGLEANSAVREAAYAYRSGDDG